MTTANQKGRQSPKNHKAKSPKTKSQRVPPPPAFVVGIGASAGGLAALERFFAHMPADSGLAFVVIQHLSPDFKSLMDDLLARHTTMAIHRVTDGTPLEANSIYLIPPKSHMTVKDNHLHLIDRDGGHQPEHPIDLFFSSLADDAGDRAVAIVLSGTGSDGSRGVQDIHRQGGLVLVQSFDSAEFDGMPRSAVGTGFCHLQAIPEHLPDIVIGYAATPPDERQSYLRKYVGQEDQGRFQQIFSLLRARFGLDFSKYKPATVTRRIERRMQFSQIGDLAAYAARLSESAEEQDALYQDLLIGVTEFFRDPAAFRYLERSVLPELFARREQDEDIRVWSAGCATGEEAYSLAILLTEQARKAQFKGNITIFATDVHRSSLDAASQGLYEEKRLKNLSRTRRDQFFQEEGGGMFRVKPVLRKMIVFAPHNLLSDPPFTRMDLVCCRNLLIYLQPKVQDRLIATFHFALLPGGTLLLGSSEGLGNLASQYETLHGSSKIFRKVGDLKVALDLPPVPPQRAFIGAAAQKFVPDRNTVNIDRQLLADYDRLLDRYLPAGFLVDQERRILHCFGAADNFLLRPRGRYQNDIVVQVKEGLQLPLSTALHRAAKSQSQVVIRSIPLEGDGRRARYDLTVDFLLYGKGGAPHLFVGIAPSAGSQELPATENPAPGARDMPEHLQQRIVDLELELEGTRHSLQASIEELQATNQELQATNEELLASNQELQSTNEELHSVNEELYTVNAEFELKNQELKQLNQDHENLLASSEDGTVYLDQDLRIRKFNPAIGNFFKLLPQDIGRPIEHIAYHLSRQGKLLKDIRQVLASGNPEVAEIHTPDDHWLLKRILPFRTESGEIEGVVLIFTDITRIKSAEQALAEMNQKLEQLVAERTAALQEAKDEADRANAAKSVFLANMSHEIRTPMTALFSTIELIETTGLSREQAGYLQTLKTSAGSLLAILDQILDFSKIEAGRVELHQETIFLSEFLDEVLDSQRPALEIKNLQLEVDVAPELPDRVTGDRMRVKQILSNLLSNAIKFTERGRVSLAVARERESADGVVLRFTVADTGIGLPPEILQRIFQPFTQGDASITRRYGGTGLGLAISKQLVEQMGGEIVAENNPSGGAVFQVLLPFASVPVAVPGPQPEAKPRSGRSPAAAGTGGCRILLAEDDRTNRELLKLLLEKMGHRIRAVENGQAALELLRAEPFDLVLMDVSMPELDGLSATRRIRNFADGQPNREVPVIALTAHAREEDRVRILAAGMSEVLTKPFTIEQLNGILARFGPPPPEAMEASLFLRANP